MGKFDEIVGGLARIPPEIRYSGSGGLNYQYKIDQAKEKFTDRTPSVLITMYADLRAIADAKEDEAKELRVQVEAAAQLLMEVYEGEGITSLKIKDVGTFRTDFVPYSHVANKEEYHAWCLESGFGPQMTLPWQTTNSVTKERILSGQDAPPGVDVYVKPTPVFTREK